MWFASTARITLYWWSGEGGWGPQEFCGHVPSQGWVGGSPEWTLLKLCPMACSQNTVVVVVEYIAHCGIYQLALETLTDQHLLSFTPFYTGVQRGIVLYSRILWTFVWRHHSLYYIVKWFWNVFAYIVEEWTMNRQAKYVKQKRSLNVPTHQNS